ncbi:ubiquitin carboxyl-terminal hydrolase 2 isoform X3 [Labrus bergylta]|uniref:ubiquitin carboxyl-terminal hydrolase 2 isoform X3 n=1 Tax=Labrus bergylta TaxID=56723 RepID=UPI0009B35D00|nr:ubiquitin carboxyl-terminal hydrolase 2-like isoform X3 [Labrus bergylta]
MYEQQDAAEYFEKILNLTSDEASQMFHGMLTNRTTCSACDKQTETDGPFWHLPLALVDSDSEYSVVNGIEEYFTALEFSGDNQMYCDKCDDKRDATIKCELKHYPEVLTLLLKKFELDYSTMTYIKMNHTVSVPFMLQIPENQTYELYAFVEHSGDLRGGHYTATIKSQEDETQKVTWYNFNDTMVTLVGSPFQSENFQSLTRSESAYLLFYRKNAQTADTCTPATIEEAFAPGGDQCQDAAMVVEENKVGVAVAGFNKEEVVSTDSIEQIDIQDIEDRVIVHPVVKAPSPEPCVKGENEKVVNAIERLSISPEKTKREVVQDVQDENDTNISKAKKVNVTSKTQTARKKPKNWWCRFSTAKKHRKDKKKPGRNFMCFKARSSFRVKPRKK